MDSRLGQKLVPMYGNVYEEIRYFNDDAIQLQIEKALEALADDVKVRGAVLKMSIDDEGVRAVVAIRPNQNWTIGVIGEIEKDGDKRLGIQSVWTW